MAEEINVSVKPTPVNPVVIKGAIAFSAEHARIWAEGTDGEVEQLGGEHSAKGWAEVVGEEGTAYTDQQIALAKTEMAGQIATASQGAVSTANAYTDEQVGAEATARGNADLILQGNIDSTQTALNNCVKKNESPTLNAGDEYRFNFVAGTQRAKLELTGLGFELKNETTGAEINLRSYDDVQIQAPQNGYLSLIQKGDDGARIELIKDITINSASGREVEIKQRQGSAIKVKNNGAISFEPVTGQAVYVNNNPVITTNDKATTSALGVVKVDGETISANDGVISVTPEGWQKPADWPDMRSGAMDNSVYLLIGHSADYSTYPQFDFSAKISNGGTYDVYIDGIKQFTTASEATTSINWQTLALTSGRTTTHPTNLVTHIVCITPTSYSNTFLEVKEVLGDYQNKGLLWAHFEIDYAIVNQISSSGGAQYRNPILEAITAKNDELKFNGSSSTLFWNCEKLQYVPKLDLSQIQRVNYYSLRGAQKLKKIRVSAGAITVGDSLFQNAYSLTELPPLNFQTNDININNFLGGVTELKDTTLNFSRTPTKKLTFGGTSSKRIDGLKGLTVNSSAPFDNATAPQLDVKYTGLDRVALVNLFNSMPTVSNSQVCNITGTTGAADLTAEDLAIATNKGWTVTR